MKSICIITSKYPTKYNPAALVFVQQLVWAIADLGINCTVICPIAVNIDVKMGLNIPKKSIEVTSKGSEITVYYPKYIGFGQQNLRVMNTAIFTLESFTNAIRKVFKSIEEKPEIVYGHFISPAGVAASRIGREFNIPAFLSYGESSPWSIYNLGIERVRNEIKNILGIISVSTHNKNELIRLDILNESRIKVFPNAVRTDRFYPRSKIESRKKLGLPLDSFIIGFVGHFIKRKGIDEVINVVNSLDDVYAIYAGKGPISPSSEKTLYNGLVNPTELPFFYSAVDVFLLPTQNEGCCNAIIEAMACGVPIISSNLPFNEDILCRENSISIDPSDTDQIRTAVMKLRDNLDLRSELSKGCLEKAEELSLSKRAEKIVLFMDNMCQQNDNDGE